MMRALGILIALAVFWPLGVLLLCRACARSKPEGKA